MINFVVLFLLAIATNFHDHFVVDVEDAYDDVGVDVDVDAVVHFCYYVDDVSCFAHSYPYQQNLKYKINHVTHTHTQHI